MYVERVCVCEREREREREREEIGLSDIAKVCAGRKGVSFIQMHTWGPAACTSGYHVCDWCSQYHEYYICEYITHAWHDSNDSQCTHRETDPEAL